MDSARVRTILQAVQDHGEGSISSEERDPLVSQGLLHEVDAGTQDRWTAGGATLPTPPERGRGLSPAALATPGPTAPPELRQMVANLEELSRQKTNLDSLVWNAPTQEYVLPTLAGRSVLADLTTWQQRLEGRTFSDFLQEMDDYRAGLFRTVNKAQAVYAGLVSDEEMPEEDAPAELAFTNVDFRFASMILAQLPIDAGLSYVAFQAFHHET